MQRHWLAEMQRPDFLHITSILSEASWKSSGGGDCLCGYRYCQGFSFCQHCRCLLELGCERRACRVPEQANAYAARCGEPGAA